MGHHSTDSTPRRTLDHALLSAGAFALVVTVLVGFDARVRQALVDVMSDTRTSELAHAGAGAYQVGEVLVAAVAEQSIANAPLMIFVVIAAVLTLFMVRT